MKLVGFIKEHNCIKEAVAFEELVINGAMPSINSEKIVNYLNSGTLLLAWMGYFVDKKTKKLIGPDSYYTDGIWIWPSYFSYYLEMHPSMKIDPDFLSYVENKNFKLRMDDKFESQKDKLEKELSEKLIERSE